MAKSELFGRNNPGGPLVFVDESRTTGEIWFVSSGSGSNSNSGLAPNVPLATLAAAISAASAGDRIYLMEGHAETTTALAVSKAGLEIIGLGAGRRRPALTATTASTDLVNVTAANVTIKNVRFVGAASGCTALLDIAGDDFTGEGLIFEHGATPLAAVTVPGSFSRGRLTDCVWRGTAAGPDYSIYFENGATTGTIKDWQIVRPHAQYSVSAGLDNAFLRADRKCPGLIIRDAIIIGVDTLAIDINSSTIIVGDGLISNVAVAASAALTSIEDVFDVGGMVFDRCYVSDVAGSTTGRAPITTAS